MKKLLIITFLFSLIHSASSQEAAEPATITYLKKQSIIVVPYTKAGQSAVKLMEEQDNLRLAIKTTVGLMLKAGYITVQDFGAVLDGMSEDDKYTADRAADFHSFIADKVSADIIVTVDPVFVADPANGNMLKVGYSAIESGASTNIASITGKSQISRANEDQLIEPAINATLDLFLAAMRDGMEMLQKNGRPVNVLVTFESSSSLNLNTHIDSLDMPVKDVIMAFIEEQAVEGNYRDPKMNGPLEMTISPVRIMFVDEKGKPYKINKFNSAFSKYLRSKGLVNRIEQSAGGTIHVILS